MEFAAVVPLPILSARTDPKVSGPRGLVVPEGVVDAVPVRVAVPDGDGDGDALSAVALCVADIVCVRVAVPVEVIVDVNDAIAVRDALGVGVLQLVVVCRQRWCAGRARSCHRLPAARRCARISEIGWAWSRHTPLPVHAWGALAAAVTLHCCARRK